MVTQHRERSLRKIYARERNALLLFEEKHAHVYVQYIYLHTV